jgi:hypothetical protein
LSAAPAQSLLNECHELITGEQAPANLEDRIVFRAPTKSLSNVGSKRSRSEEDRSAKRTKVAGVKNTKLLSFGQEDEDDSYRYVLLAQICKPCVLPVRKHNAGNKMVFFHFLIK